MPLTLPSLETLSPWRTLGAFAHPAVLLLLLTLPLLGGAVWWAARRRRRALVRLGPLLALRSAAAGRPGPRRLRGLFLVLGLVLVVTGAAGPQWGRDWLPETV